MVHDLWTAARNGTAVDVRLALTGVVKGSGSNGVDSRNAFGVNALHLAVWHNHLPSVRALLEAGADPDARDGESGWSSLHRALHFGHLAVAAALVDAGASLLLEDSKKRTPLDLISGDVKQTCDGQTCTEVYAWGSGTNYQLGTRTAGIQRVPVRLDHLQGLEISTVSAAKFHSAAVTRDGELFTWGFGRGGRLGHPDFHIHSGQVAVITPRQVITGLGGKQVRAVAAAKHHTVIATEGGEVYTWGSNRDGRLGYTSVDSQPTPRRISSFRLRAVAVAASNKHSAVLTKEGEVFTWGCNGEGQLGYGTSNSAANSVPRLVEAMKGKPLVAVSVAKYYTVVLSADGEVYTWGHKLVMPRRVNVARDTRKAGPAPLKFHRAERLHAVAIAAGGVHSTVISQEGLVFYWESSDVQLRCRQLKALAAHHAVSASAGKHRTAIITSLGTVFAWDGTRDQKPEPLRIPNLKQTTQIAVGESHSVAVATIWIPPFPIQTIGLPEANVQQDGNESDEELERERIFPRAEASEERGSLKDLCEREIARSIVETKNVLQMTELADALEADRLKAYCQAMVLRNLDYILMVTPQATLAQIRPSVLAELEGLMGCHVAQGGWVPRTLPCATASGNVPILEEQDGGGERARESRNGSEVREERPVMDMGRAVGLGLGRFLQQKDELGAVKRIRALRKKLQQIEALEARHGEGYSLDSQQRAKLRSKEDILAAVDALEQGREPPPPKEAKLSAEEWKIVGFSPDKGEETEEGGEKKKGKGKPKKGGKAGKSGRGGKGTGDETPALKKSASETSLGVLEAASPPPRTGPDTMSILESLDLPKSPVKASEGLPLSALVSQTPIPDLPAASPLETPHSTLDPSPSTPAGGPRTGFSLPPTPNSWSPATPQNAANPKTPKPKKTAKRGGLSMFLSGALEAVAAAPTPPPMAPTPPKSEGPAWGGVGVSSGTPRSASLREIQNQQGFTPTALPWSGPLGADAPSASGRGDKPPGSKKVSARAPGANPSPSSSVHVAAPQGATWQVPPRAESCSPSTSGDYTKWGSSPQEKGGSWSAFSNPPGRNRRASDGGNVPSLSSPIAAPPKGAFTPARLAQARSVPAGVGTAPEAGDPEDGGPQRISLAHFVRPEKLSKKKSAPEEAAQKGWAARTPQSAAISASSLRAIQEQQEKQRRHREGFSAGSPGTSPAPERASPGTSPSNTMRWYKPDPEERPSNIRAIQTEEAAMKALRKIYGFDQVRLVTGKGER